MTTGGYGSTPWGFGWGSGPSSSGESLPTTGGWEIFDLGGVSRTDINRLTDFVETETGGQGSQFHIGSWVMSSGGAYPTDIAFTRFDVEVTETFTIEYTVTFNNLPEDFSDPTLVHSFIGAWSSQDYAAGFLFSKSGVAYVGEAIILGGAITFPQSVDVIPGSSDWFPSVFSEGGEVTVRIVVNSELPTLYLYITKTSELPTTGHVLRALLFPKETQPGVNDEVLVSVRGSVSEPSSIELVNDYRMSFNALIPNVAPVAIPGDDQAARICSIVRLDAADSFDPEGENLLYEWRLIDAPIPSIYSFGGVDGSTAASGTGYTNQFFSDVLGVEHAREPVQVNDVLIIDGVGYTIKTVNGGPPFSVEVEYSQLVASVASVKYKLIRQVGLNTRTSEKPTFYPDTTGFFVFDLRVNDGTLWSSPLGLDRSRVLVDVRESPLPRACPLDTTFIFDYLPSFWRLVEDRDRITALWNGIAQATASELYVLWQHEYSKSLRDIQRQLVRRWLHYDLMLPEPVPELGSVKYMWNGVVSSRFETTTLPGKKLFVSTPFIGEVEIPLTSPGNVTPSVLAAELQLRLQDLVDSRFTAEALELNALVGGSNGTILDTGVPANNILFETVPLRDFIADGIQSGDVLTVYSTSGVPTSYNVTGTVGATRLVVSSPFPSAPFSGVSFKITRTGSAFGRIRVNAPFYFTFTSSSTLDVFFYPSANSIPSGLRGMKVSDRAFKVELPVPNLEEDDLLVIGYEAYRVSVVGTHATDEYDGLRVTVKESIADLTDWVEWAIPGWVSSELLNFYNGLIFRGDVVEFEAAQESDTNNQVRQAVDLVSVTALGANAGRFDRLAVDTSSLHSQLPTADAVARLARVIRKRYVPVDALLVDVPTLQETIVIEDDEATLRRNVDYFLEEFRGINALRFQTGLSVDEGDVWEAERPPDRLWAEYTYLDNEPTIEANFGAVIGVLRENVPTSVDYLSALQGLWYVLYNGPTVRNLRVANQILLGLPFAEVAGTIEEIRSEFLSKRSRVLIRDTENPEIVRSYTYPRELALEVNTSTGLPYAMGDTVEEFAPLVQGVAVYDYINNPTWFQGLVNQGIFYEAQKYHTFTVRVDTPTFTLSALEEAQRFTNRVKPTYTGVWSVVVFGVSVDGDEIDVIDSNTQSLTLNLFDSVCGERLGASYHVDEPWLAGTNYDPLTGNYGGNTREDLANHWRNRADTADGSAVAGTLPTYPTSDSTIGWAVDRGGYVCPDDVFTVCNCEMFSSATPMMLDSIFSVDVGETYIIGAVTYYGPPGPGERIEATASGPFVVTEAGVLLGSETILNDGTIRYGRLTFFGPTSSVPEERGYVFELRVDAAVELQVAEEMNINSELTYLTLGVGVSAGQTAGIYVKSPAGEGTKNPGWTSVSGFMLNDVGSWYADMGEPDYPGSPGSAPAALSADTYCGILQDLA